jgi:N-acyl-D-aspartate/D-glutamate deacylase
MGAKKLRRIPWDLIAPHEKQAQNNHDQSLKRLAERGGLDPIEAMLVLQDQPLKAVKWFNNHENIRQRAIEDEEKLAKLAKDYISSHR